MDNSVTITIGPGELIDRMTILHLKLAHVQQPALKETLELRLRDYARQRAMLPDHRELSRLERALSDVNSRLWAAEDMVRRHSADPEAEEIFLKLARDIPRLNDSRAALKVQIDEIFGWSTTETKCYG